MNKFPENLGKPDIKISGLEIWIHGNQFPEFDDYWDGNWMNITAKCTSENSCVWVSGSILHAPELQRLMTSSEKLYENLKGEAVLPCIEPELSMKLEASSLGQINMTVNIDEFVKNRIHQVLSVKFYVLG